MLSFTTLLILVSAPLALADSLSKRCEASIRSLGDVEAAKKCTTINIHAMSVPSGKTLDLSNLLTGTHVIMHGDVTFNSGTTVYWEGPLFRITGNDVTFHGAGRMFDGQGSKYWDGKGGNGGKDKPKFMKISNSGTFKDLRVINQPVQAFSVGSNKGPLLITNIEVDVSAGNKLGSDGEALGHNTDCFDVSGDNISITRSKCNNQDDCLALNSGKNFLFDSNTCTGGHGISIGSIKTGKTVDNVVISNNKVINNTNGLRIKTYANAKDASVSNVNYIGNTITGATRNGIVIQQDYENGSPTGTATNDVPIKNVRFSGATTSVSVSGDKAQEVYVLCGSSTCSGDWNWSSLKTSGETKQKSSISPSSLKSLIKGYSV